MESALMTPDHRSQPPGPTRALGGYGLALALVAVRVAAAGDRGGAGGLKSPSPVGRR